MPRFDVIKHTKALNYTLQLMLLWLMATKMQECICAERASVNPQNDLCFTAPITSFKSKPVFQCELCGDCKVRDTLNVLQPDLLRLSTSFSKTSNWQCRQQLLWTIMVASCNGARDCISDKTK